MMTAKEKADELKKRFDYNIQHCIICVEEILKAIDFDWMEVQNLDRQHDYWNEVLTHLKK